jgi:hypothetical protein
LDASNPVAGATNLPDVRDGLSFPSEAWRFPERTNEALRFCTYSRLNRTLSALKLRFSSIAQLREPIADLASGCGAPRDRSCPTIRLVLSFFWKRFLRLATQERVWRWIALEERGSFLDELSQAIDLVCIVGRWPKQFALVTHCSAPLWQAGARRSLSHRRLRAEPQPMILRQ